MKLIISYSGLDDASNGNHMGKIISWLITMRTALWIPWNANPKDTMYLESLWMIGMYPAFVIFPVSGSLVCSSSHENESVRVRRCSI